MRNPDLHKLQLSKATTLLWLAILLSGLSSFSQTTNISGVINSYYRVIDFVPAKSCVRLSNTFGINPGDRILLIQMKGGSMNIPSPITSVWGDTTALNNAGNYEVAMVCMKRGDSIFFVHTLLNNYTPATGKVQLVKFGQYATANVTDTLRASPWNDALGTGGVIALYAEEDLILNKPISANNTGFSGGAFFQSNTVCSNGLSSYAYNATVSPGGVQNGAFKGEGIADIPAGQNGGRGAPANGGGGGNNHNNSGGGGANLARGGLGGGNSSNVSGGCNAAFRGEPGKALSSWSGKKIFAGGGGGAGHNNNAVFISRGGNGGGIIFIQAGNIIGNGYAISANGEAGGNTQSDGAGGGGGAGTIILHVAGNYNNVTIQANGGDGGASNDGGNIKRCFGGGGGGSGGAIYVNGPTPSGAGIAVTVNPGAGGVETGGDVNCLAQVPGVAGNAGDIINGYTFRIGTSLAAYCSAVLPVRLSYFKATVTGKKVALQWNISEPDGVAYYEVQELNTNNEWVSLSVVPGNDLQREYTVTDENTLPGYNSYRLKVTEKSNAVFYSLIRRVYIESENDEFIVYPNPAHSKLFIKANYHGFIDIRLLDLGGKSVLMKRSMLNIAGEIDLPALPAGVYILRINNSVKKLVIQ